MSIQKGYRLESSAQFSEEYVVTYWDRKSDYVKQSKLSVFFAMKGASSRASRACQTINKCKEADIISVKYQ